MIENSQEPPVPPDPQPAKVSLNQGKKEEKKSLTLFWPKKRAKKKEKESNTLFQPNKRAQNKRRRKRVSLLSTHLHELLVPVDVPAPGGRRSHPHPDYRHCLHLPLRLVSKDLLFQGYTLTDMVRTE